MNTRELWELDDIDERELAWLVGDYVRRFRRLPSAHDLRSHGVARPARRRPPVSLPCQRSASRVTAEVVG